MAFYCGPSPVSSLMPALLRLPWQERPACLGQHCERLRGHFRRRGGIDVPLLFVQPVPVSANHSDVARTILTDFAEQTYTPRGPAQLGFESCWFVLSGAAENGPPRSVMRIIQ